MFPLLGCFSYIIDCFWSRYRLERKHKEKEEQVAYKLEQEIALWNPNSRENSTQDPFKTLFVARINYDTSQSKLRRVILKMMPSDLPQIHSLHMVYKGCIYFETRGFAYFS